MSLPRQARPSTAAGRPTLLTSAPSPSPATTHRSGYQASPLSTQRSSSKAGAIPSSTPVAESPFSSSRSAYTGIRHLLAANDINIDEYPDGSTRPRLHSSIEHLFSSGAGGLNQDEDAMPEGYVSLLSSFKNMLKEEHVSLGRTRQPIAGVVTPSKVNQAGRSAVRIQQQQRQQLADQDAFFDTSSPSKVAVGHDFSINPYTSVLASAEGIQVKRPQSSAAAFSEVSESVRGDVIENFQSASKERKAAASLKYIDKSQQPANSDIHSSALPYSSKVRYTIDTSGNVVDRSSFQEFTAQEALQQSAHMKRLMDDMAKRTRDLEVSLRSADLSPRPSWPVDSDAEAAKSAAMEVRLDLEMQTRASNQLLRQMEHKLADEAIMMDEIEVLLGVMRDNLTPSLTTSETQYLDADWRVKREKVEEETEEIDWSKGLGKGVDIPEYLWWKKGAQIRLRNLSKRDTELFIKDVWKAKKIADAMKKEKSDIHKFIMQYCQKKFGNFQNVIVENMASLMHAIEIHKEDADIEMFGEILAGRLEEGVYTAQLDACDNLMKELKKRDMQLHMGKTLGYVTYSDFLQVLQNFFNTKVPVRIDQLMQDILEGHPGENDPPPCAQAGQDVKYESLFKEDREYNQGPFAESVRDGFNEERLEYVEEICEEIFQQTRVDPNTPSEEFTTASIVISSWIRVDPAKSKAAIMSVLEKLQKMAAARQREWDNDKIDQTVFKLYLSRILIQRSSMSETLNDKLIEKKRLEELAELERLEKERQESADKGLADNGDESADPNEAQKLKEKKIMESVEDAKERLAAIERMKKAMTVGTQTTSTDKNSREVFEHAEFTIKFDADGLPTLAPAMQALYPTSSLSSSSAATTASARVWLLPCLRRPMLCYSGQKASLLPPHLFLAYFQEILHFRLRFPVRPDCAPAGSDAGGGSGKSGMASVASVGASLLSLQATVAQMRRQRKSSVVAVSNAAVPAALSSVSSDAYKSAHKCVKLSWCSQATLFDGFCPAESSFPDFALRFFQAVFGQKASADIMCRDFFLTAIAEAQNGKNVQLLGEIVCFLSCMNTEPSRSVIPPADIFSLFLTLYLNLKSSVTKPFECAAELWLIPMTQKKKSQNSAWLPLFTKGLATNSVVSQRSWKTAVDRTFGALLPISLCEELYALSAKDKEKEQDGHDFVEEEKKEIMCDAWGKIMLAMQILSDHQKKFLENIEIATHRLTRPPYEPALGITEFWQIISFCGIEAPPGIFMDVYADILDRSVGNRTLPCHVIESLGHFHLISFPVAVCRASRLVADHNAACLSTYAAIVRSINKSKGDGRESCEDQAQMDPKAMMVPAQAFNQPQFPAFGAALLHVSEHFHKELEIPDFSSAYSEARQLIVQCEVISNRCVKFGPRLTGARHPEYAGLLFRPPVDAELLPLAKRAMEDPVACHIESSPADASSAAEMLRDLMRMAFESQVKLAKGAYTNFAGPRTGR